MKSALSFCFNCILLSVVAYKPVSEPYVPPKNVTPDRFLIIQQRRLREVESQSRIMGNRSLRSTRPITPIL